MSGEQRTQPSREEILSRVRDIVDTNPERWEQRFWLSNAYRAMISNLTVDEILPYIGQEIPRKPSNPTRPVCGTEACVAGWLVIVGSPPGTKITNEEVIFPNGDRQSVPGYAAELVTLKPDQKNWLFDADRNRGEVLDALAALILDPYARIGPYARIDEDEDEDF